MDKQSQPSDEMQKLADLIDETHIAMLTTLEPDGSLRSRPLATRQFDSEGNLWFFTSLTSPKAKEIERDPHVNLAYANPKRMDYVSVSGTAELIRDRAKMKELWTPWIKPWFPNGLDDPDLALLRVSVDYAEYWDAPGSTAKQVYGLAKAVSTGKTDALGEHGKVRSPGRPNA